MNNLYVFAIGGSGERIMHSFIMMLAAGMPIGAHTVIPVFIDNDVESEALTRCTNLIDYYRTPRNNNSPWGMHALYDGLGGNHKPSFAQANIGKPIMLKTNGAALGSLESIIGELRDNDPLQRAIAEERDLLFTTDDLEMRLDVGFVGNPNIGSIVLNYMTSAEGGGISGINLNAQDGVMVLGSLFGGTGAAGLPLIINSFYKNNPTVCPLLGGVAVLPYFNLPDDDTQQDIIDTTKWNVHADTFDARTRAALMYYADYMQNMDYCYYVGDNQRRVYDHHIGGAQQNNPTNLVEVMAALSIFDFAKQNVHPTDINYKRPQWGFVNGDNSLSNVSGILNKDLKRALVKFQMMKSLFDEPCFLKNDLGEDMTYVKDLGITENHLIYIADDNKIGKFPQAWGLQKIFREWDKWIQALGSEDAKRQFQLFNAGQKVDADNLTRLFYTDDSDLGIAKMGIKKEGGFLGLGGKEVKYPLPPQIANELTNAYDRLYPKGTNPLNIKDDERLGKLLQVLSLGLDNVIDKNCTL